LSSIIFGPINSRRFGKSLGVDVSPNTKQCNFDCLYCELKPAQTVATYNDVVPLKEVIEAIKKGLQEHKNIDFLTITANGEPTLYPFLNELIEAINSFKGSIKTLILSNGSRVHKKEVQEALKKFDVVKLSLDCATSKCFKKLDRNDESVSLEDIKKGMLEFKKQYKGFLQIEILFVEGLNDKKEEIAKLNEFLLELKPDSIDLSTIDRPPAFDVKPLSFDKMHTIAKQFDKNLPVQIVSKNRTVEQKFDYSKEEIINTLQRRPLSKEDIDILFTPEAKENLNVLLKKGKIVLEYLNNQEFYRVKE